LWNTGFLFSIPALFGRRQTLLIPHKSGNLGKMNITLTFGRKVKRVFTKKYLHVKDKLEKRRNNEKLFTKTIRIIIFDN
tara:strand:+ start:582 stop:818 length:237 start_codon:yes stop_codon:yes gene_type:complete